MNDILLADLSPEKTFYRPGKYRGHQVRVDNRFSSKKLVLNGNGDTEFFYGFDSGCDEKIPPAMKALSSSIISLTQTSPDLPLAEYARQVSQLHFRYINIHPFSNGNGRTGRMLINMLLKQRGVILDLSTPGAKGEYDHIMSTLLKNLL